MVSARLNCLRLPTHTTWWAFSFALASAGMRRLARMAIMAITTRSSMSVNPRGVEFADCSVTFFIGLILSRCGRSRFRSVANDCRQVALVSLRLVLLVGDEDKGMAGLGFRVVDNL